MASPVREYVQTRLGVRTEGGERIVRRERAEIVHDVRLRRHRAHALDGTVRVRARARLAERQARWRRGWQGADGVRRVGRGRWTRGHRRRAGSVHARRAHVGEDAATEEEEEAEKAEKDGEGADASGREAKTKTAAPLKITLAGGARETGSASSATCPRIPTRRDATPAW